MEVTAEMEDAAAESAELMEAVREADGVLDLSVKPLTGAVEFDVFPDVLDIGAPVLNGASGGGEFGDFGRECHIEPVGQVYALEGVGRLVEDVFWRVNRGECKNWYFIVEYPII